LDDLAPDPPLLVDTVRTHYSVDLRLVADVTEAPVQEIVGLNPSLLRGVTPPDDDFDLHLPVGTKELFEKRIAEIPEDKRRYWRFHKLVAGESMDEVARAYHVPASEITFVNQLSSPADLSGLEALIIPVAPVSTPSLARTALYRSRTGDTLVTVADRFGVTVDQLKRWNHLTGTAIPKGRALYVAEPARIPAGSRKARGRGHAQPTRNSSQRQSPKKSSSQASKSRTGGEAQKRAVAESRSHR
jgi:membrane-bound lytic murein transglycosylase D